MKEKVKILDTYLNPKNKIAKWKIKFLSGSKKGESVTLSLPVVDLAVSLGVNVSKLDVPDQVWLDFFKSMEGKEINLDMIIDPEYENVFNNLEEDLEKIKDAKTDELESSKMVEDKFGYLDKYPIQETLDDIMGEDENKEKEHKSLKNLSKLGILKDEKDN